MPIHLYNTLTRRKETLRPRDSRDVRMYVCGPTVYDFAHVGNARPVVVFDVLYRLLRHVYGEDHVKYVRNITDVDDKIIATAKDSGEEIGELTRRTIEAFHADMAALGTLPPTHEPRATKYVEKMQEMIARLIERGHAYVADDHVLFSVPSLPDYGRLSRHNRQQLIDGARVEVAPYKRDPADFVLWKPSTSEQPGWNSPWGYGRPGWHIECSAMSAAILGEHFDIHGGGQDLIFPHHENELAQSVCAQEHAPTNGGEPFVNIWMHNGYVTVGGEKMSKSLGNFFTVRQLLEKGWHGEEIRLVLLSAHYRQPLDFTEAKLNEAKEELNRFYFALRKLADVKLAEQPTPPVSVIEALSDDLNTPLAISRLHETLGAVNQKLDKGGWTGDLEPNKRELLGAGKLLGLLQDNPEARLKARRFKVVLPAEAKGRPEIRPALVSHEQIAKEAKLVVETGPKDDNEVDRMIAARAAARKVRNFAEADRIRDDLAAEGIILEDLPDGTTDWRRR